MPFPICPHCGETQTLDRETYSGYRGSITCGACKWPYEVSLTGSMLSSRVTLTSPPIPVVDSELLAQIPGVPGKIWRTFMSAARCLAFKEPLGSAVLCRRVVQHSLLAKGLDEGAPSKMVDLARQQGLLSEIAYRNCRAAVFMGGKAAHPQSDPLDEITKDDARQAILATRAILRELFKASPASNI